MLQKEDLLRRIEMRQSVEQQIHTFFQERGFLHVQTPLLVRHPDMQPTLDPMEVTFDCFAPHQITAHGALITSPEFSMKKLLGSGLEKIYTITKVFRGAEGLAPHNTPEFTMLEWYGSGDYTDCMQETQELVNTVLQTQEQWPQIAYKEANVDEYGDPHIEEQRFFLKDYPAKQAALAQLSKDGTFAERFEAFADGMELCNGFTELLDADVQRERFEEEQKRRKELGKTVFEIDEELLEALPNIKGPVYGNALGVDRLIMLKYGVRDINSIQLFPALERFID